MDNIVRDAIAATRKRKDREDSMFYNPKGSFINKHSRHYQKNANTSRMMITEPGNSNNDKSNPGSSNQILAGYMAYEFLTKGTLLGQKFDPARAVAMPVSAAEPVRRPGVEPEVVKKKPNQNFAEVSQLLKGVDGAHIPGIVNPAELARWIQM